MQSSVQAPRPKANASSLPGAAMAGDQLVASRTICNFNSVASTLLVGPSSGAAAAAAGGRPHSEELLGAASSQDRRTCDMS